MRFILSIVFSFFFLLSLLPPPSRTGTGAVQDGDGHLPRSRRVSPDCTRDLTRHGRGAGSVCATQWAEYGAGREAVRQQEAVGGDRQSIRVGGKSRTQLDGTQVNQFLLRK